MARRLAAIEAQWQEQGIPPGIFSAHEVSGGPSQNPARALVGCANEVVALTCDIAVDIWTVCGGIARDDVVSEYAREGRTIGYQSASMRSRIGSLRKGRKRSVAGDRTIYQRVEKCLFR